MSLNPDTVQKIQTIFGRENARTDTATRYAYAFDASIHHRMPDIVVRPLNAERISALVKLANERKFPVVARGGGTALCGQSVPVDGGVCLDMQGMNRLLETHLEDLYVVVEPGIIYDELNALLKPSKFQFPCAPGSGEAATIGGMVAVNASGMRAIKYGATRDYVLGLEAVLPTGEIATLGTRTLKNSCGYQLDRLLVGSEGTLGIITKINLRVVPIPKAKAAVLAAFDKLETAGQCVSDLIAKPLLPSSIELMDRICIEAVNKGMKVGFPDCEALLIVEVDGHPAQVKDELAEVIEVVRKSGATAIEPTEDAKRMDAWTAGRKAVLPSLSRYGEKWVSVSLADDMAVPMSQVPKAVAAFQRIAKDNGILVGTYGHASDGNLHTKVLVDPKSEQAWRNAEKATGEIFDCVLSLGGTVTGEHGVGISKAPFFARERRSSLHAMVAIKKALDPNNVLNPHKMMQWQESIIAHLRYPAGRSTKGEG